MIPVIKWEVFSRRMSLLWWSITTAGIITMLMLIYPSIREQATQLNAVLNQLPESLRSLKTGSSDVDIASPTGYLHSQLYYSTLPLILGIFTISLGKSLGSRDEKEHTLDLALSRPISRATLLTAKGLSGLLMTALLGVVTAITAYLLSIFIDMKIDTGHLLTTTLWTMLLVASFGVIAFSLSAAHQKLRHLSVPITIFMSFGGYMFASLSSMTDWLEVPAKLLPFYYFDPNSLLNGEVPQGLAIYLTSIFVVGSFVAWQGFRRRDLD